MNIPRRTGIAVFWIAILLGAGILFWPVVLNDIIAPVSLMVWFLLRIFVLSIGQDYYWGAIIFVVVIFLIRLLSQDPNPVGVEDFPETNATIKKIGYWNNLFTQTGNDVLNEKYIKRELIRLLLSLYASKRRTPADFKLFEALRYRAIPLPEHIHDFLFPDEPKESRRSLKGLLHSVRETPRRWIRRWTGREIAYHFQMLDEVICFMEDSLEIKK
jgi:hypothetical protein